MGGFVPRDAPGRLAHKRQHLVELRRALEDVDLVDDDHDFLAPGANRFDKGAFRLGEGTICRGHEQDEIGPRHELGRQALVLADDGVRARRVDDVEVLEELDRRGHRADARAQDVGRGRGAVADEVNVRRRGRHALVEHAGAEQGIDERALAGVELADDDQEEELVELPHRLGERGGVGARGGHATRARPAGRPASAAPPSVVDRSRRSGRGPATPTSVRSRHDCVHCRWVPGGLCVDASAGADAFSGTRRAPSAGASRRRSRSPLSREVARRRRTTSTMARSRSRWSWSSRARRLSAARRCRRRDDRLVTRPALAFTGGIVLITASNASFRTGVTTIDEVLAPAFSRDDPVRPVARQPVNLGRRRADCPVDVGQWEQSDDSARIVGVDHVDVDGRRRFDLHRQLVPARRAVLESQRRLDAVAGAEQLRPDGVGGSTAADRRGGWRRATAEAGAGLLVAGAVPGSRGTTHRDRDEHDGGGDRRGALRPGPCDTVRAAPGQGGFELAGRLRPCGRVG